ncbi:MAG TPA: DsbA family protein [Solirubrobacteraceae bacterium]|jgi:2-hydroxychromene-2-carboxylate isomerase
MRAAVWAAGRGDVRAFARAAFAMAFQEGIELSERAAVLTAAERAGHDPADLDAALGSTELKQRLRAANNTAIAARVYGVPTFDGAACSGGAIICSMPGRRPPR